MDSKSLLLVLAMVGVLAVVSLVMYNNSTGAAVSMSGKGADVSQPCRYMCQGENMVIRCDAKQDHYLACAKGCDESTGKCK